MESLKNSATLAPDCLRWLKSMREYGTDHWLTENGDLVTDFECKRILGLNDELDQNQ